MLPGKRDFYLGCKARSSASQVNKEFWQQFKNYSPPSLRVIRTKVACTIIRNVLLSAQMGERASVVLICIITSQRAHTLKLFCMYDKSFEISKKNRMEEETEPQT